MSSLRHRPLLAALGVVLLAAAVAAQKLEVKAEADDTADFDSIRTYGLLPPAPMITNVAPGAPSNPELSDAVLRPHIVAALDAQLARRGLVKVEPDRADVQVAVLSAMTTGINSTYLGEYYGYVTGFGSPFMGTTPSTSARVYEQGTIVVDIVNRAQKRGIWRGSMKTRVVHERTLDERVKRINEAMERVFRRFPIKVRS